MTSVTIEAHAPADWAHANGFTHQDGRAHITGCVITARYTFCGRDWVNYRLPAGCKPPATWDKVSPDAHAALTEWVH